MARLVVQLEAELRARARPQIPGLKTRCTAWHHQQRHESAFKYLLNRALITQKLWWPLQTLSSVTSPILPSQTIVLFLPGLLT